MHEINKQLEIPQNISPQLYPGFKVINHFHPGKTMVLFKTSSYTIARLITFALKYILRHLISMQRP